MGPEAFDEVGEVGDVPGVPVCPVCRCAGFGRSRRVMADMVDVGHPRPSQGVPPQGAPSAAPSHLQRTNAIDGIRRTPEERLERRGGTQERLWWSSRMEHVEQISVPAIGGGGPFFKAFRKAEALQGGHPPSEWCHRTSRLPYNDKDDI